MRWFLVVLAALLGLWITYLVSPYWALYRLGQAVERRDVAGVVERVNVAAVRLSLARQIAAELAAKEGAREVATAEAQRAAAAAVALAEPYIRDFVTSDGILRLLRTGPSGEVGAGSPFSFGDAVVSLDDLDDFLSVSNWRGFRNVYVSLPPDTPRDDRFRFQLRLSALRWRLVAVELPQKLRRQLVERVVDRVRSP